MQASVQQLIQPETSRLRPWVAVAAVIGALLLQAYLPLFSSYANMVDLPLVVTIYLALQRRSPVAGLSIGAAIGLVQDSLSHGPVGLYGIIKTMVGYIASSLTGVLSLQSLAARVVLVWCFYLFHQAAFWIMERALLGRPAVFVWSRSLLLAAVNAGAALVVFRFLDRFREQT
jgi:rod shape-determining protein MreD